MGDKKERSYEKAATKTSPTGIRFDIEKLSFVQGRENVPTKQKVVDFLLNKYWWENKLPHVTAKEAPPLELKNKVDYIQPTENSYEGKDKNTFSADEVGQSEELETELDFIKEISQLEFPDEYLKMTKKIKAATHLPKKTRDDLILSMNLSKS